MIVVQHKLHPLRSSLPTYVVSERQIQQVFEYVQGDDSLSVRGYLHRQAHCWYYF